MTGQQLKEIVPSLTESAANNYAAIFNEVLPRYNITTPERIRCFISQVAHESDRFRATTEYASGKAYEGRKDLGNVVPGDGVKFKGRGLIQVTGRSNYKACSLSLFKDERLLQTPEILAEPKYAVESACWYWRSRKLNEVCDLPDTWTYTTRNADGTPKRTYTKFQWLTKLINGGQNGLLDRQTFYNRAKRAIPNQ
jgi:putative chitinase